MKEPAFKSYLFTYFGLLGLLLLNTLIAYINLGWFSTVIAIGLAIVMACLVAGILMHGFYENKIVHIIIAGAVIFLLIMMTNTLGDYFTRGWLGVPGK